MSAPQDISEVETRPNLGSEPRVDVGWSDLHVPGQCLGRYVILETVGHGGMGRVLRAYDPKLQREVALKVLHTIALEADAQDRLVREARAMARLSHPNVVAVHDVIDTPTGLTLVMELVPGKTLRSWLDEVRRPWRDIVARFVEAGRGIAAAHAEGLLHRDFKPANVLVPPHGPAKVTDFGLAKLVSGVASSSASDPTASSSSAALDGPLTQAGTVIGTPRYMAPEQHMGDPIGPAADQYAFCVALWEALTGRPPFEGSWPELVPHKLAGPPPWPSGSPVRGSVVAALRRGIRVSAEQRWPSMQALLDALTPAPRLGRRQALAIGFAILGTGTAGWYAWTRDRVAPCTGAEMQLTGIWDSGRRSAVQAALTAVPAAYAEQVWTRTADELDGYASAWKAMHVEACEATTVRGEQSAALMDLRMACLDRAKVGLAAVTGVLVEADAQVVQNAHQLTDGLPALSRCSDLAALHADAEPPRPEDRERVEEIRARLAEVTALREAGRYTVAQASLTAAIEPLDGVDYDAVRAEVAYGEGLVLQGTGKFEDAERALRRALRLAVQARQWTLVQGIAVHLMSVIGFDQQRALEGLQYRELAEGLAASDPRALGMTHSATANILNVQGKYVEAEAEHRRALELHQGTAGSSSLLVATTHNNLAVVLEGQGKHAEAEAEIRRALELREAALGPDHPLAATSLSNLANVLHSQGKHAEAEATQRLALERRLRALGPDHPHVAMSRAGLASHLKAQGKLEAAEPELRRALESFETSLGPDHPHVGASVYNLANLHQERGDHARAEIEYVRALAILEKSQGPEHPHVVAVRKSLIETLEARGKREEAAAERSRLTEDSTPSSE